MSRTESLRIKPLLSYHYKSVKHIFDDVFRDDGLTATDLHRAWRYMSRSHSHGLFTRNGQLVGFVVQYFTVGNPLNVYLAFIAICPSRRGGNLGSKLLSHCLRAAVREGRSTHLYSLDYIPLKRWYYKHGFSAVSSGKLNFHSYRTRGQEPFIYLLENTDKPLIELTGDTL
jgi:ribosomal protein S18 acetylase RimI-like enzyme